MDFSEISTAIKNNDIVTIDSPELQIKNLKLNDKYYTYTNKKNSYLVNEANNSFQVNIKYVKNAKTHQIQELEHYFIIDDKYELYKFSGIMVKIGGGTAEISEDIKLFGAKLYADWLKSEDTTWVSK